MLEVQNKNIAGGFIPCTADEVSVKLFTCTLCSECFAVTSAKIMLEFEDGLVRAQSRNEVFSFCNVAVSSLYSNCRRSTCNNLNLKKKRGKEFRHCAKFTTSLSPFANVYQTLQSLCDSAVGRLLKRGSKTKPLRIVSEVRAGCCLLRVPCNCDSERWYYFN